MKPKKSCPERMTRVSRWLINSVPASLLTLSMGCQFPSSESRISLRLVDRYEKVKIDARITQGSRDLPRTEWRFDREVDDGVPPDAAANRGWRGGIGVAELTMQNGNLTGRTTTVFPILHVERTTGLEDKDLLHEVEIRVRVSAGANLAISFQKSEVVDIERVLELERAFPWLIRTPLLPGDQFRTYILQPPFPVDSSAIRHVLVRPTDAVGARFEIESIRLVFRREHLARIPSGIGWHALSGIYRETIVSRFPETSSIHLKLTKRPRLDLYIGTLEEGPITFQVAVARNTQSGKIGEAERIIFNQTVTTPHRWEPARVDLTRFANEEVTLSLSLEAAEKGALGFWGSAVVRNPGVPPPHSRRRDRRTATGSDIGLGGHPAEGPPRRLWIRTGDRPEHPPDGRRGDPVLAEHRQRHLDESLHTLPAHLALSLLPRCHQFLRPAPRLGDHTCRSLPRVGLRHAVTFLVRIHREVHQSSSGFRGGTRRIVASRGPQEQDRAGLHRPSPSLD